MSNTDDRRKTIDDRSLYSVLRIAYRTNIKHHSLRNKIDLALLALSPCCAAAYDMQTEISYSPAGGFCSSADKQAGILTYFQTMSTKK